MQIVLLLLTVGINSILENQTTQLKIILHKSHLYSNMKVVLDLEMMECQERSLGLDFVG